MMNVAKRLNHLRKMAMISSNSLSNVSLRMKIARAKPDVNSASILSLEARILLIDLFAEDSEQQEPLELLARPELLELQEAAKMMIVAFATRFLTQRPAKDIKNLIPDV